MTTAPIADAWVSLAREELLQYRRPQSGWGYRRDTEPSAEPTILASLALSGRPSEDDDAAVVASACEWLTSLQQADGSVAVNDQLPRPGWNTATASLLWRGDVRYRTNHQQSIEWLLGHKGLGYDKAPDSFMGHDTSLIGWPWVAGTHSWVEPTSFALIALKRSGYGDHPRVEEGIRLLCDRALPSGGWNCGNTLVMGTELRPRPPATGLALLALAGEANVSPRIVDLAGRYLQQQLPRTRSPQTLCWGILGLTAWGRRPADADEWLAESYTDNAGSADRPMQLAYNLLAAQSAPAFIGPSRTRDETAQPGHKPEPTKTQIETTETRRHGEKTNISGLSNLRVTR